MSDDKSDLPSKEEVKQKAGLFWRMSKGFFKYTFKGLFRLIIPKKWDKEHITISIVVIIILILVIVLLVKPVISLIATLVTIAAVVLVIGGLYMVFFGKSPLKKE